MILLTAWIIHGYVGAATDEPFGLRREKLQLLKIIYFLQQNIVGSRKFSLAKQIIRELRYFFYCCNEIMAKSFILSLSFR